MSSLGTEGSEPGMCGFWHPLRTTTEEQRQEEEEDENSYKGDPEGIVRGRRQTRTPRGLKLKGDHQEGWSAELDADRDHQRQLDLQQHQ